MTPPPHCLKTSDVAMHADDTTIYYSSPSMNDINTAINADLEALRGWLEGNKLSLNVVKTQGLNPPFMKEIFMQRNISYSLRFGDDAQVPKVRTTSFGVESIAYLGNKPWQILSQEIKQSNSLPIFKKQIKCWNGGKCSCRLCKAYIPKVGFLTG